VYSNLFAFVISSPAPGPELCCTVATICALVSLSPPPW
jgi:hypothetical protein